jgi:Mg2+ and Co2+ transporter CorA
MKAQAQAQVIGGFGYAEPSAPATPIESELIEMTQNINSVLQRITDIEQTITSILRQDPPVDNMAKALEAAPACEMQTRLRNLNRDLTFALSRLGSINARVQL